jgi:hypothetical protein
MFVTVHRTLMRLNSLRVWVRFGLAIGLESEGLGRVEWEFINGYCFMLPVDPFNVAACGEPGEYAGGRAAAYGVLPDRARVLPEKALVRS